MKIVFATGNPGKLQEAAAILGEGFELVTPAEVGIAEDIPETGNTLRANSLQKADYIYKKTGLDCFADDTGPQGFPGFPSSGDSLQSSLTPEQSREFLVDHIRSRVPGASEAQILRMFA